MAVSCASVSLACFSSALPLAPSACSVSSSGHSRPWSASDASTREPSGLRYCFGPKLVTTLRQLELLPETWVLMAA